MKLYLKHLYGVGTTIAVLAAPGAFATTSDVVLDVEGNPTCNSLANNSQIVTLTDNSPPTSGGTKTIMGPNGQEITYTMGSLSQVSNWKITTNGNITINVPPNLRVNFTILKARGSAGARVFHFGTTGVTSDTTEEAPGQLSSISFCYGLSKGEPPPPESPNQVRNCTGNNNQIDNTFFNCPANGETALVCNFEPDKKFFGLDDEACCFCNPPPELTECNPDLSVGKPGACPKPLAELIEVPSIIEAVKNPGTFYCITTGGTRRCYSD